MKARAIVIGGSGGIGNAIVERYATAGADVHFTYLRAQTSAARVAEACEALPGNVSYSQLDVRDAATIADLFETVDDPSVVVFCAASGVLTRPSTTRARHWDWTLQINVRGFGLVYQAALPGLARVGGSLVALTSVGGRGVLPGYALVGAAKAGIESTVRYAAVDGGGQGVRVNAVCPGIVDTRGLAPFPNRARHLLFATERTPLGRLVTPADVADVVWWLGGPGASMITGQVIVVDGGWELTGLLPLAGHEGLDG